MNLKGALLGLLALLPIDGIYGEVNTQQECLAGSDDDTCKTTKQPTCKFYLAPSSIPNSGFGVYTTQAISKETPLTDGSDAPSVMVYDGEVHSTGDRRWSMENYFWSGEGSGQFEATSVEEYVVTFGTSCNFHTYLKSIFPTEAEYDDTITPRAGGSPGMGAYSYHGGALFYASRDIAAGEEIFADYGDDWLDTRPFLKKVPRQEDFTKTAQVITKILEGLDDVAIDASFLSTIADVVNIFNTRIPKTLLPKTVEQLTLFRESLKVNATVDDIAHQLGLNTLIPRDMDWIVSEGKCLDNLISKVSTVPDAGRGGFAQRFIAKGDTVIIAPLLHIMDNDSTYMYPVEFDEEDELVRVNESDDFVGQQLITNYCFGHDESSMYLCPQTNAILINHCSTRQGYGGDCEKYNKNKDPSMRGANAEIRWAEEWDPDTKSWLKMSVEEIARAVKRGRRGLSFEVVAKRDIYPGDEVFIDYGEEWENEWKDHVAEWEPPSSDDYIPIVEMEKLDHFRTTEELESNPYHDNIITACAYWLEEDEIYDEDEENLTTQEDWISDGSDIAEAAEKLYDNMILYWPCNVLSRERGEDGSDVYEVEIFQSSVPDNDITIWHALDYRRILQNFTATAIRFMTAQYSSDQHLMGVFRSPLRIPDDIFPEQWRDRR